MENEIFNNFKTILSNAQLDMKVRTDVLRTTVYSFPQSDPDVQTLMALAASQVPPVALPTNTDRPAQSGLADYSYCSIADLKSNVPDGANWHAQDPGLADLAEGEGHGLVTS